ncbi:MAG: hypothetical protein N2257_03100 [Thermodesulfovibrionales bacterium]|nr:hypothetical protein [Thermodesulfovibrionales bacterium]
MKSKENNYPEFKVCDCSLYYWENIVVSGDEDFDDRTTIHYHCALCSEDYAVVDFDDPEEILYLHPSVNNKFKGR